ncbi:MAG TPA: hypothetical protein VI958_08930, partial [Acidobacteriota bacterium]
MPASEAVKKSAQSSFAICSASVSLAELEEKPARGQRYKPQTCVWLRFFHSFRRQRYNSANVFANFSTASALSCRTNDPLYTQEVIALKSLVLLLLLCVPCNLWSMDEMAQYELLEPSTHQFAIRYDVSATKPGTTVFFNIIRPG